MKNQVSCLLVLSASLLMVESALIAQLPDDQIFPQIFHVDDSNTSIISVQNPGFAEISVSVDFFDQGGNLLAEETRGLPARSAADFASAAAGSFVGVARVSCDGPCLATTTWNFSIGAGPSFEVGTLPQLFGNRSLTWAAPVPLIAEGSSYGFAIYNTSQDSANCDVMFRGLDGETVGTDQVSVPAGSQVAQFSEVVTAGFVGGAVISCDQDVIALGLNQNTANGFPTSLNLAAVPSGQLAAEAPQR